jgi:hypothetical protein
VLEILETKILAYSLDITQVYLAIGICLLGLGVSGTLLAILPPRSGEHSLSMAGAFAVAAAVATVVSHQIFAALSYALSSFSWATLPLIVALTAPYFCMGMTIALLLSRPGGNVARTYALNLVGSGVGCLLIFPLLDSFGAERTLLVVAGIALVSAVVLGGLRSRLAAALMVVGLGASWGAAERLLAFPPDPTGQLSVLQNALDDARRARPDASLEIESRFSRWDRTARVDVYEVKSSIPEFQTRIDGPFDIFFYTQDASAGSFLLGVRDDPASAATFFERTVYGAGYELGRKQDVLIIGLGGGPDVIAAHYYGAENITGVEINRTAMEIGSREFRDFMGDPYGQPNVTLHNMDGRSFVRGTDQRYDLIQMSGVDTKALLASGSLSVNENYLYTRQSLVELLSRLKDDGVLALIRINGFRLASIADAALREMGASEPEKHIFAIRQSFWVLTLVKRTPFTDDELATLHRWVEAGGGKRSDIRLPFLELFKLDWSQPMVISYSPLAGFRPAHPFYEALHEGRVREFVDASETDLRPPDDDRPFFFFRQRPWDALTEPVEALRQVYWTIAQLAGVSAVFTLLPLVVLRRRGLRSQGASRSIGYFACLGGAFMLLEIGLIARFVLLLGHQSYAITVVLFGFMLGAGLGSFFSARISISSRRPLGVAIAILVSVICLYGVALGPLFDAVAAGSFGLRLTVALVLLVGLGFLLGIPFPTALRALETRGSPMVAWAIGVNGFASVIGSSVAIPIAMLLGFRFLLLLAALLYGVAIALAPLGGGSQSPEDEWMAVV